MWARRCETSQQREQGPDRLQWGRAFVGAEIRRPPSKLAKQTPALQWGRAFVGAEIAPDRPKVSIFETLQWGRAFVGAEILAWARRAVPVGGCFNGAAPLWARRYCDRSRYLVPACASMGPRLCGRGDIGWKCTEDGLVGASMGPRLCGRGDKSSQKSFRQPYGASMGPRLCGRGDSKNWTFCVVAVCPLQWGRAFVGAEISANGERQGSHLRLQWGRAFVGAEITLAHATTDVLDLLQWGRAFVGAEMPLPTHRTDRRGTLQWGRAFVGAEIGLVCGGWGRAGCASMGPRLCGRGDWFGCTGGADSLGGFNGAAPLWARRSSDA